MKHRQNSSTHTPPRPTRRPTKRSNRPVFREERDGASCACSSSSCSSLGLGYLFVNREKTTTGAQFARPRRAKARRSRPPSTRSPSASPRRLHRLRPAGETAAWDETTIYARVNGYVAKWFVDIGDW